MAERRREIWQNTDDNVEKTHSYSRNADFKGTKTQLHLDGRLNSYFKLSHRYRTDEGRLELYWKNICEQENNSKKRNKSLMEDFERIEQQVTLLDAKTKKLKDLRDNYESYINKMYPRWLDELKRHRHMVQQERNNVQNQVPRYQAKIYEGQTPPQEHIQPRDYRGARPSLRFANHVRFTSPDQSSLRQEQDSLGNSSLYDSQYTRYQDYSSYFDQSSTQDGTDSRRYRTMDWDPYHREPSFDYYHFGQVSSMRTPHSHMHQHPGNDFLRFSTPYHPGHSGPLDPRNGFDQTFDMSYSNPGSDRGPHPRYPCYIGTPMMYPSPDGQTEDHRQPLNNEHIRPVLQRQGVAANPDSISMSYPRHGEREHSSKDREQTLQQQSVYNGSILSEPTSPYARDPPEKPLEQASHHSPEKNPVKSIPSGKEGSKITSRSSQNGNNSNSQLVSNDYISPSPLDLHDLRPVSANTDQGDLSNGQKDKKFLPEKAPLEISEKDEETSNHGEVQDLSDGSLSLRLGDISDSDISLPDKGDAGIEHKQPGLTQGTHDGEYKRKPSISERPAQQSPTQETHDDMLTHKDGTINNQDSVSSANSNQRGNLLENRPSEEKETKTEQEKHEITETLNSEDVAEPKKVVTKDTVVSQDRLPSVTTPVFLALLQAVDADVEVSFSPETLYRAPQCSQSMKEDIIRSAENSDNRLDTYDPSTISMIVLEELTLLVRASPSCCLIKDQVLLSGETYATLKQLRTVIEPTLVQLWDALLTHMTKLVRHNILAVDEVAKMFGIMLLKQDSDCQQKFQTVLINLIKKLITEEEDDLALVRNNDPPHYNKDINSKSPSKDDNRSITSEESSTLGSTPPNYEKMGHLPSKQHPDVPPLSLERTLSYDDDFEDDDVPLNETAAYRKMMSSAQSTVDDLSESQGKIDPKGGDSEGDDDLERTLARSISPPPMSPRQHSPVNNTSLEKKKPGRHKPKLSLFGGCAGSLGLSYGSEELEDSWGGDENGKLTSSWKSNITDKTEPSPPSSPDLDPDLDPDLGTGYIPSTMDSDHRKEEPGDNATKPSAKMTRKPGFWNHSDTESEVDLQLSTGAADADDDDFDFYG